MSSRLVYDEVRNLWVRATPEEIVRQQLLTRMIRDLKFPKELICVEKELSQMPHLLGSHSTLPDRRADIICFANNIHPEHVLYPLLLIECKDEGIGSDAVRQLLGYNHFVKARFVALANHLEVKLGYFDAKAECYQFLSYLPSYSELLESMNCHG